MNVNHLLTMLPRILKQACSRTTQTTASAAAAPFTNYRMWVLTGGRLWPEVVKKHSRAIGNCNLATRESGATSSPRQATTQLPLTQNASLEQAVVKAIRLTLAVFRWLYNKWQRTCK